MLSLILVVLIALVAVVGYAGYRIQQLHADLAPLLNSRLAGALAGAGG